jgi:glycosyltransferase involved in cell wall biosynthesis
MEQPTVSVVVPVYNAEQTIEACLESLLEQSHSPLEVILVDNGSTDRTSEKVDAFARRHRSTNLVLVSEKERGPAVCRNTGVRLSKGDILCFTDSDCVTDADWIRDVLEAFRISDVGAVAGNIFGYQPSNRIQQFLSLYTLRGAPQDRSFDHFSLTEGGFATANLSVRRKVFDAAGGFDEDMRYGEDHDLCSRIMDSGYRLQYIHKAVVHHIHRRTFRDFVRQSFFSGIGHAHLLQKYRHGVFLMEFIGRCFRKEPFHRRIWINAISADKKLLVLALFGLFAAWGWLLPLVYGLHLANRTSQKAKAVNIPSAVTNSIILAGLLVIKSFCMTLGRWTGSFRYGVICL